MEITLSTLDETALEIGKGRIFYATSGDEDENTGLLESQEWDGTTDLELAHLGDTQGPVRFNAQESIGALKLPEHYNEGVIRAYVTGADPVLNAPLLLANPGLRRMISPSGDTIIGSGTRSEAAYHTLVIMPERLFFDPGTKKNTATIAYLPAGWRKFTVADPSPAGRVLTDEELRLLGLTIWIPSGYWERPPVTFEAIVNDAVVNVEECTFHARRPAADVLDGIMAFIGLPEDNGIDIQPVTS